MLDRLMRDSPIKLDKHTAERSDLVLSTSESTRAGRTNSVRPSPIKLQHVMKTESPGKTFDLTQMSSSVDDSPRKALKVGSRRLVSLNTSRDIIRASKQELVNQLTSPKESFRNKLLN